MFSYRLSHSIHLGALALSAALFLRPAAVQGGEVPLKLVQTIPLPGVKKGFDHFATDATGDRIFSCVEWHNSVEVFNSKTGEKIHSIGGLERPHSIYYRGDLDRLYIVDGTEEMGAVRIFNGKTYEPIKTVELLPDADWLAFDPKTNVLYVTQGGDEIKHDYSIITAIDTTAGEKVGDIKVNGSVIEDIAVEKDSLRMYLGNKTINGIDVIDREKREVIAHWPMTMGKDVAPLALDESNHRLFAACRAGSKGGNIVVFDTATGKELTALPINEGCDDLLWDPASKRLYATCAGTPQTNGSIDIYYQADPDHYTLIGNVATGLKARNGLLVRAANRYYVGVPQHETTEAKILVFELTN